MASPKKRRGRDLLQFIAYSVIAGFLVAVIVVPPVVGAGSVVNASMSWFQDLPDEISEGPLARPSTIYAADGKTELATFYEENRTQVKLDQISPHMRNAIISVEDRDFYSHGAVSAVGIGRAFFNNAMNPGKRQGASTLTQQYVNNLIVNAAEQNGEDANATLGGNKNYFAKIKEMKLAVSMEQNKSKDEILEGYLNIVNMGGSNFGVEAAAQYYWGIPAKDLNVAQSALLAGLVQSPNTYRPDEHPDNAVERRNVVLSTMLRDGKISQQEYDEAVASEVNLDIHPVKKGCSNAGEYAFFCNYVVNNILQDESYGATDIQRNAMLQRGGLKIYTSLNTEAQKVAKQAVESTQPGATNTNDINTALTSIEPSNGNVVAMAQNTEWGSPKDANDHSVSQFNYNVDAKYGGTNGFQPRSTFKPVILAQWIKDGKGVNGMVNGTQLSYPTSFAWNAKCYDETGGKYYYRNQPVYQYLLYIDPAEEAALNDSGELGRDYHAMRWHPFSVDLLHADGSKARGIKRVCEALGVPLDETMAFGDGLNDVEMFKTVGYGVAMGDAVPELRALAQYQTGTVEEDGIYNALQHLGII